MKRIALVTGATGGIGCEFVRQISDKGFDEIWAIGRNTQKLSAFNGNVVPIKADIGSSEGIWIICDKINNENVSFRFLIGSQRLYVIKTRKN